MTHGTTRPRVTLHESDLEVLLSFHAPAPVKMFCRATGSTKRLLQASPSRKENTSQISEAVRGILENTGPRTSEWDLGP